MGCDYPPVGGCNSSHSSSSSSWLVVGTFFHIWGITIRTDEVIFFGNVIIPTDELIFFRGVGIPPTNFTGVDTTIPEYYPLVMSK